MKLLFKVSFCFLLLFMIDSIVVTAAVNPLDMVYVPAGYSMMGAEPGDLTAETNAKPNHLIYLDPFYIDVHEVTNSDYAICVAAGACKEPEITDSKTRKGYYWNTMYANFPVVNVTWQDAVDYCSFVEKRLPTEAEWERAARGVEDNRRYPWGDSSPKSVNLNISKIPGDTERVSIYNGGISPYGAMDMLGNVSEWVSDWYDEVWYSNNETENPKGPSFGTEKTVRGSSFETSLPNIHVVSRFGMSPENYSNSVGFRCALSVRDSVGYNSVPNYAGSLKTELAYIKAGNDNGIFLLTEPGTGYGTSLICVVPNGAVVEILAGPVSINYSDWYQIQTQSGEMGWTIGSSIVLIK